MKKLILLFTLAIALFSCKETSTEPEPDPTPKTIDELVRNAGELNTAVNEHHTQLNSNSITNQEENGKKWDIKETRYSLAKNLGEAILPLNPNAGTLWVGGFVQGNEVHNGILNSLGENIPRKPITITVESGASLIGNLTIENPSKANYSQALNDLLKEKNVKGAANQRLIVKYAHSKEQAALQMGFSAKWFANFSANFETKNNSEEKSIYLLFKQIYFTASTSGLTKASDYFADGYDPNNISHIVKTGNPLCYVASIDYGRMILVKMTYKGNESSDKIEGDVKLAFGGFEAGGSYNTSILSQNCTFEGLILGGSNGGAAKALTSQSLEGILNLIKNESEFNANSTPAYPISYVVKNMSNNTVIKLGETTEYTAKEYTFSAENQQSFKVEIPGFYIKNDCEPMGDGDFYFDLELTANNKSIKKYAILSSQTVEAGNGEWVELGSNNTVSFSVSNFNGSFFRINGSISERNSVVDDIVLTFDKTFNFPWSSVDIDNGYTLGGEPGYYGLEISRDSGCNIILMLKITKL